MKFLQRLKEKSPPDPLNECSHRLYFHENFSAICELIIRRDQYLNKDNLEMIVCNSDNYSKYSQCKSIYNCEKSAAAPITMIIFSPRY